MSSYPTPIHVICKGCAAETEIPVSTVMNETPYGARIANLETALRAAFLFVPCGLDPDTQMRPNRPGTLFPYCCNDPRCARERIRAVLYNV